MENFISAALQKKRKSQGWLSKAAGLNRPQICRLIAGKIENPSVRTALKVAKALGLKVEDLWTL